MSSILNIKSLFLVLNPPEYSVYITQLLVSARSLMAGKFVRLANYYYLAFMSMIQRS